MMSVNYLFALFQALEQQAGAPDDFQEIASREKGALKRKFSMDAMLEDKICDLYDLFVDVMIYYLLAMSILEMSCSSVGNLFT